MPAVVTVGGEHGGGARSHCICRGIRRLESFWKDAVFMGHGCRIEERDLNGRLEVDVQQLQQLQFVGRRFCVQSNQFSREFVGWPGHQRRSAEATALRDQALRVLRACSLVVHDGMLHERDATGLRQGAVE